MPVRLVSKISFHSSSLTSMGGRAFGAAGGVDENFHAAQFRDALGREAIRGFRGW